MHLVVHIRHMTIQLLEHSSVLQPLLLWYIDGLQSLSAVLVLVFVSAL